MSSEKLAKLAQLAMQARTLDQFAEELDQAALPEKRITLRKVAALLRTFDRGAVRVLAEGLDPETAFEELINEPDVEPVGPDRWRLRGGVRERYRADWESSERDAEFRDWNRKLGAYLLTQPATAETQLDALYHLAVGDQEKALAVLRDWYDKADARFDMTQCSALLEILRIRARWRGRALSREYEELNQYYVARTLFFEDYYRTGRYYERRSALDAFAPLLDDDQSWVFHLHATGGVGKTIFLRWLVARYLVPRPRRIACARVDFDDFKLVEVVNHPLQLLILIVEQIDRQLPNATLTDLLEKLQREKSVPGWNDGLWSLVHDQLRGAQIEAPVVVILDTLEEATLSHGAWLAECIRRLGELRQEIPRLKLVLSGRYDITERMPGVSTAGWITYELRRFSKVEADEFLTRLSVDDQEIRAAIVERTIADETDDCCNPFKLSLFAELALSRKTLTRDDVLRFPRADFAYLIERIIARIESQPLRWAVRYGAVFRELTLDAVDQVLLASLTDALSGNTTEYGIAALPETEHDYVESLPPDERAVYLYAWRPDPEALAGLSAAGVWESLGRYARDRGWLSVDEARATARFHPEVAAPMRDLLRRAEIYTRLQRSALDYFEQLAATAKDDDQWVRATGEAIFHLFQLEGARAEDYWQKKVAEAERRGFMQRAAIAGELLKKEYAEAERIPLVTGEPPAPIVSREALAKAHSQVAESLMLAAGASFSDESPEWGEFRRHVELARLIEQDAGQPLLPALLDKLHDALGNERTAALLRQGLETAGSRRERFFLEWQLARVLTGLGDRDAVRRYRSAIKLFPDAAPTGFGRHEIWLRLADWYQFAGDYSATKSALDHAAKAARHDKAALTLVQLCQANLGLVGNDLESTEAWVLELPKPVKSRRRTTAHTPEAMDDFLLLTGRDSASFLLEARYDLARLDPVGALDRGGRALDVAAGAADQARARDVLGEAHAMLLNFSAAFDAYDLADGLYDQAGIVTGAARCMVQRIKIKAQLMGHYRDAELMLTSAEGLRGAKDVEIASEIQLLRAIVFGLTERAGEARELLKRLERSRSNRAASALVARIRLVIIGLDIGQSGSAAMGALCSRISRVRPDRARMPLLDVLEFAVRPLEREGPLPDALLRLFVPAELGTPGFFADTLRLAHLCRVFGDRDRAAEYASRASKAVLAGERVLIPTWRVMTTLAQLGATKQVKELARKLETIPESSTLAGAVNLVAANAALATDDLEEAEQLLALARNAVTSETLVNRWHAEVGVAEAWLAERRGDLKRAHDLRHEAAAVYGQLGDQAAKSRSEPKPWEPPVAIGASVGIAGAPMIVAAPRPDSTTTLRVTGEPVPFSKPAAFLGGMFSDWRGLAGAMANTLGLDPARPASGPIRLELPAWACRVPWEMAAGLEQVETVYRRSGPRASRRPPARPRMAAEHGAILIVRPESSGGTRGSVAYEAASGADLESVYYYAARVQPGVAQYVDPGRLHETLASAGPTVVHVVAAVREFSGGVYLDFSSTEQRISMQHSGYAAFLEHSRNAAFLEPSLFDRVLSGLKEPPFVILDVTRPANQTAMVEMLLLRNQFATRLFEFGNTLGILAIGLTSPDEREFAIGPLIQRLVGGASVAELIAQERSRGRAHSIDSPPFDLVSSLGAALFSDDPSWAPFLRPYP